MLRRKRHPARPQLPLLSQTAGEDGLGLAELAPEPAVAGQADGRLWLGLVFPDWTDAPGGEVTQSMRLSMLAQHGLEFTPLVCVVEQGALLLEIGGSIRLFGGLETLLTQVRQRFAAVDQPVQAGVAVTATAALWLARANRQPRTPCNVARVGLAGQLASLPVAVTGWPEADLKRLQRMGVHTVGDCQRLPREGFARRLGPRCLRELDRARGLLPELFHYYQPPVVFHERLGFAAEIEAVDGVFQAAQILLQRLAEFLRRRQLSVARLTLRMEHYGRPASTIELALREPIHSTADLRELLRLKLDAQTLAAPVIGLGMDAPTVPTHTRPAMELLDSRHRPRDATTEHVMRLTERLQARLGDAAVHGLGLRDEYRPEKAWRRTRIHSSSRTAVAGTSRRRPLWLLPTPRRLEVRSGRPSWQGALDIVSDVERIESGWWDGQGIRRDYFIATGKHGRRWWIYRERAHWYLHGIFG